MAGLSDFKENAVLDELTGRNPSATRYVALYTVAPTDAGGGTEVTGGAYVRKSTAGGSGGDWQAAAAGATQNANAITFVTASGANWGTVVAFALFDAATGGNMLVWNNLVSSKTISIGETGVFAAGDLDLTAD